MRCLKDYMDFLKDHLEWVIPIVALLLMTPLLVELLVHVRQFSWLAFFP